MKKENCAHTANNLFPPPPYGEKVSQIVNAITILYSELRLKSAGVQFAEDDSRISEV
jgi:hypothetical protein